jgi:hypothetical protein
LENNDHCRHSPARHCEELRDEAIHAPDGWIATAGCAFLAMTNKENDEDDSPGVPGFRTWRGVYLFVFGCFLLVVFALTLFARFYA